MIVNWKKENAGVLVLPCVHNKIIIKKIFIVPGHNEVPVKEWKQARPSAIRHLDGGTLIELVKKVEKKIVKKEIDLTEDLLTLTTFPFNEVMKIMKQKELYTKICAIKKQETKKATIDKKWLLNYMKEVPEDWEIIESSMSKPQLVPGTTTEKEVKYLKLTDVTSEEATIIINDTFNLDTLEQWKKEISQPDLRVQLMNQIEVVCTPPKGHRK